MLGDQKVGQGWLSTKPVPREAGMAATTYNFTVEYKDFILCPYLHVGKLYISAGLRNRYFSYTAVHLHLADRHGQSPNCPSTNTGFLNVSKGAAGLPEARGLFA